MDSDKRQICGDTGENFTVAPLRGRSSNIELLRILAMFGVCLCHTLFVGVKANSMFGASE